MPSILLVACFALMLVNSAILSPQRMISRHLSVTADRYTKLYEQSVQNAAIDEDRMISAAVLPGGAVTGTLTLGAMNFISLYSNILIARFALSWFPQLMQQFPILRPIITVTDPYLQIFRRVIPPIGGFDISALPAIFVLDIASQTAAAVGAEIPKELERKVAKQKQFRIKV